MWSTEVSKCEWKMENGKWKEFGRSQNEVEGWKMEVMKYYKSNKS